MVKINYEKENLLKLFSTIVKHGEFTLSSGKKSNFYIDCKELLLTPGALYLIAWWIDKNPNIKKYYNVAGLTSGADPIVCTCVTNLHRNGLFIRKQQKGYGTKKLIEGKITELKETLIVDDVLTTGDSLRYSFETLKQHEFNPIGIVVLVDREENSAKQELEQELNIPIYSILTRSELLENMTTERKSIYKEKK